MSKRRLAIKTPLGKRLMGAAHKNLREGLYDYEAKRNEGVVSCFVCRGKVTRSQATLEHIVRKRDGGDDSSENLAISHEWCNLHRDLIEKIGYREARKAVHSIIRENVV